MVQTWYFTELDILLHSYRATLACINKAITSNTSNQVPLTAYSIVSAKSNPFSYAVPLGPQPSPLSLQNVILPIELGLSIKHGNSARTRGVLVSRANFIHVSYVNTLSWGPHGIMLLRVRWKIEST